MDQLSALTPFGLKCRELRFNAGRRVIEHADQLGIEAAEISEYETGRKVPGEEYVRRTAYWLRTSPGDLECLLARRPNDASIIDFDQHETKALTRSRRSLKKIRKVSALVLKLQDFRKG